MDRGLTPDQLWLAPAGTGTVGFHIRHIAGSTERLMSYFSERDLTPAQLEALAREHEPGVSREELLAELERSFAAAEAVVRAFDPARLAEPRSIGRKRLPTTAIGLLTHIAEHTQRHVGQAIVLAQWVRTVTG